MYLFFDTETTGFPPKARIVQLAALLTDENGNELKRLNSLVKPDNWTIPDEVVKIHHKTNKMCEAEGRPMLDLLKEFNDLLLQAKTCVAHNMAFDTQMIKIESVHYGFTFDILVVPFCTMIHSKNILRLPHRTYGYKNPKLSEAYRYFFGKDFDNAHDARADVIACKEVFFKLMEMKNNGNTN